MMLYCYYFYRHHFSFIRLFHNEQWICLVYYINWDWAKSELLGIYLNLFLDMCVWKYAWRNKPIPAVASVFLVYANFCFFLSTVRFVYFLWHMMIYKITKFCRSFYIQYFRHNLVCFNNVSLKSIKSIISCVIHFFLFSFNKFHLFSGFKKENLIYILDGGIVFYYYILI